MHYKSFMIRVAALVAAAACAVSAQISVALPTQPLTIAQQGGAVSFKNTPLMNDPGRPNLPRLTVRVLVPANVAQEDVTVALHNVTEESVTLSGEVVPALPPAVRGELVWPTDRTIADNKDVAVYAANTLFPQEILGGTGFGRLRQYRIVDVTIHPFRYNPVTGELRRVTGGTVVVSGKGVMAPGYMSGAAAAPTDPVSAAVAGRIRSLVANPAMTASYAATVNASASAAPSAAPGYVIFTTAAIASGSTRLQALVQSRQARGFTVQVVTEQGWGGGTGDAAADNIRAWLVSRYQTNNIQYVLMIGNPHRTEGDVPMKMAWPNYYSTSYRDAPTDYYYAELTGNWDADGNGIVGEYSDLYYVTAGGIDPYAEVAVGRIPFYGDMQQLDHILLKSMTYETAAAADIGWRTRVLLPMEPSDGATPGFHLGEQIRNNVCLPAGYSVHRVYDDFNHYNEMPIDEVIALNPPAESVPCHESNVVAAWTNNTIGLNIWWSHGWSGGAVDIISNYSVPQLNDQFPSFTFQVSCDNGYPEITDNIGYTLLHNGAIGTVSASRVSWYYPGETDYTRSGSNAGMSYQFAGGLVGQQLSAGEALNYSRTMVDFGIFANVLVFNLYGLPDLSLSSCSNQPQELVFAVNSAGASHVATDGTVYQADINHTGGQVATTTAAIGGTDDDAIYQSERWGNASYALQGLEPGTYDIVFKFAETYWSAAGQRIFDVVVENQVVIDNLDIFAQVGKNVACDLTRRVTLADGTLDISFTGATIDQPKICGFAVYRVGQTVNVRPVADAGADQTVALNATVTLDGSGSYDPDNGPQALRYYWCQISGPNTVIIADQSKKITSVPATASGTYAFELTVYDGDLTDKDTVLVTTGNQPPVANAGADQSVSVGSLVTLDGYGSHDPDNSPSMLSYVWSQLSGPSAGLSAPARPRVTFTPVASGTYEFRLTVYDGAAYATDDVIVVVTAQGISLPGRIQAEDYNAGGEGTGYHDLTAGNTGGQYRTDNVDIESCTDAGGGYNVGWVDAGEWLAYNVQVAQAGTYTFTARLASQQGGTKTMSVQVDGATVATFNFTDASGWQSWKDVVVGNVSLSAGSHVLRMTMVTGGFNVNYLDVAGNANQAPLANAGADQTVAVNTQVSLDGSASHDPDNGPSPLSYAWTQLSGPSVVLVNATSARPTFIPGATGTVVLRLTVSDGALDASDEVSVTVTQSTNLIVNGDFSNGLNSWTPVWIAPATGSVTDDYQSARIGITAAGVNPWDIQLFQQSAIFRTKTYTLEFYARAEFMGKAFKVVIEHNGEPWTKYVEKELVVTQAANTWQKFTVTFYAPVNDYNVKIGFHFGNTNTTDIWLDNVVMTSD